MRWTEAAPGLFGKIGDYSIKISNYPRGRSSTRRKLEIFADGQALSEGERLRLTKLAHDPMTTFDAKGYQQEEWEDDAFDYMPRTAEAMWARLEELTAILQREGIAPAQVDWT